MAIWAYECHPCGAVEGDVNPVWYVAQIAIDEMPATTRMVKVKVGRHWRCARIDRHRKQSVEGLLLRTAIASPAQSCADCEDSE